MANRHSRRTMKQIPRNIAGMAVTALVLTTVAWAFDGSCHTTYPTCPNPAPQEGGQCGSNSVYEDVLGPLQMQLYACRTSSVECEPSNKQCNQLVRYDFSGYTFKCGDNGPYYCVSSNLSNPTVLNRDCSYQKCDPDGPDHPIPPLTPPCPGAPCGLGTFPAPPPP